MNPKRERLKTTGLGLGLLLAVTIATVSIVRPGTASAESVRAAAWVVALGTLAMGFLMARQTPYPRWAFIGTAALLGVAVLLTTITIAEPSAWVRHARPLIWMNPWLIMVMGLAPARKAGVCATTGRRGAWMTLGMGVVLGAITLLTPWISLRF